MKTLLLVFHPEPAKSVRNKMLVSKIQDKSNVTVHWVDNSIFTASQEKLKEEEKLLYSGFEQIVFQFPLYWYTFPACCKYYMDYVMINGYSKLAGTHIRTVITTGASDAYYESRNCPEKLLGFLEITAELCGMKMEKSVMLNTDHEAKSIAEYIKIFE